MELKIKWTRTAASSLDKIVEFIEEKWGIRSAQVFIKKLNRLLQLLIKQPEIGKLEIKEKGIRAFVFSRQNTVFYRIREDKLILLKFFDNRQDPKKKPK
ncbi:MAG: type II toxin-antitoxin system RelE/ParE family toxin [Bacteroidales bacterium]|jgi:plasmid stabilization system protein ParE|nr:type II toxin-antitoxin system RelE/ParE family toxin [Bacteroidales bacterium]